MRVIASVVPHGARRWARQGGGPAADREGSAPAWVSERRRCTPLRSSGASKVSIQDTTSPVSDASRGVLLLFHVLSTTRVTVPVLYLDLGV